MLFAPENEFLTMLSGAKVLKNARNSTNKLKISRPNAAWKAIWSAKMRIIRKLPSKSPQKARFAHPAPRIPQKARFAHPAPRIPQKARFAHPASRIPHPAKSAHPASRLPSLIQKIPRAAAPGTSLSFGVTLAYRTCTRIVLLPSFAFTRTTYEPEGRLASESAPLTFSTAMNLLPSRL